MEVFTHPEEIKEEFRRRRRRQFVYSGGAILLILFARLGSKSWRTYAPWLSENIVIGLFLAMVAAFLIVSYFNWRCPACDKYIGRSLFPYFCQKCGAKFGEE